jgi:hypothetical protein
MACRAPLRVCPLQSQHPCVCALPRYNTPAWVPYTAQGIHAGRGMLVCAPYHSIGVTILMARRFWVRLALGNP